MACSNGGSLSPARAGQAEVARANRTASATRYTIGLANGSRATANRLTKWNVEPPAISLDERSWLNATPQLRWIYDSQSVATTHPTAWVETWCGDRLPGQLLKYVPSADAAAPPTPHMPTLPAHVVVESVTPSGPPRQIDQAQVRVRLASLRRIVWQDQQQRYQPGTVFMRDGRQLSFRAIRWSADRVILLTDQGREEGDFGDIAELHLPEQEFWPELLDELAVTAIDRSDKLVQFATSRGVVATTSWSRQRVARPSDPAKASYWLQGVQPAWSLDVIWLPGDAITLRRLFMLDQIPLSIVPPSTVVQRSPLAQAGLPWRRDTNVTGGRLASGPGVFGWGFGVHAHNELHFELPEFVTGISAFVGLDHQMKTGGCVRARIVTSTPDSADAPHSLFESPVIVGSQQACATGVCQLPPSATPQTLVLQVDLAQAQRPSGADPLDIRDHTNWLDPLLHLDGEEIAHQIKHRTAQQIDAWRNWHWRFPKDDSWSFQHVWDELSGATSQFQLGVSIVGDQPLSILRDIPSAESPRELFITVSVPAPSTPPIQMEVVVDGESKSTFRVPLLDRDHLHLAPQRIVLPATPTELTVEIRQLPSAIAIPVVWHAIAIK